ncbi:CLUMA_CG006602, isoform A [Clunio marinus]|uniref:CLUMA_CG006602, isoform A n=1 Tax=Clunio marinus TaxID=568069 RepID=A0A1J1HY29_9DIPT|nr:CLUMA_CG006602, isoform A [Clunio marinus]
MTSRLDRLFILLESGSSAITRRAAAKQIGEVQKLHPHELHNLLNRLIVYIHSNSWETRIAASQAVQSILENVPQWNPKPVEKREMKSNSRSIIKTDEKLSFEMFNLNLIFERGARLMGSEGKEFDFPDENDQITTRELLIKQRAILNEKLGFSSAKNLGINIEEMLTLEDMTPNKIIKTESTQHPQMLNVQDIITNQASPSSSQSMSSREMNRAKRKARQNQGTASGSSLSRTNSICSIKEEPKRKKIKTENNTKIYFNNEPVPDVTGSWSDATEWPLEAFCSKLFMDLFSPRWEIRHGSATALRELMRTHVNGGGKKSYMTEDEQCEAHKSWLEDAVLRLLCVLALDRFGDFVSDQVVAPVRETCAQVMGTILKEMPDDLVMKTVEILQKFVKESDWEVRHGGILGIKYFIVVREDLIATYLPIVIKDVLNGLLDTVDDVSSVSASTLIPIASHLPTLLSHIQVSEIVKMLWDLLLDQDELAAACNNFMGLLAAILSLPNASHWIEMESMDMLIPRLWPFLSHPSSSVRRSTLQTLKKLTDETNNHSLKVLPSPSSSDNSKDSELRLNFGVRYWPSNLVQEAMRYIYQRVLVEHVEDIQCLVEDVWVNIVTKSDLATLLHAACPYVSCWMCLAMQPTRLAFDANLILNAKTQSGKLVGDTTAMPVPKLYLGGTETISQDLREKNVIRARYKACRMLGILSQFLVLPAPNIVYKKTAESPMQCYSKLLLGYLSSRSSLQRIISSMIITFWAEKDPMISAPDQLRERLKTSLTEYIYFDEIATMVTRLLQEASDYLASLKQYKVHLTQFDGINILSLDQIKELCTTATENLKEKYQLKSRVANLLEERRKSLLNSFTQTSSEQTQLSMSTQSALACAATRLKCLPEKLNPIVKPLMESIKREENEILQKMAADSLTCLMSQTVNREPSPNIKIITNLSTLLKSDEDFTPVIMFTEYEIKQFKPNNTDNNNNPYYGIITLQKQLRTKEISNGNIAGSSRGPGRPPALEITITEDTHEFDDHPLKKVNKTQRIGASFAIESICQYFGEFLSQAVPTLWQLMFDVIMKVDLDYIHRVTHNKIVHDEANNLITSLQLIEIASPHFHEKLHFQLFQALSKFCLLIQHPLKAIRHMASRCIATIAAIDIKLVMTHVINDLIPLLSQIENPINREGSIEVITCVVNKLQFKIVPYVVLLIVPILGRMSDQNHSVRLISTSCFATLIQLMPLDGISTNSKEDLSDDLRERKMKDKKFLDYLFRPKSIPDFKVPVPINAELRSYQQSGVNWLWFLNKYKLHGILCDDMGLGKTLQTICILAADHHHRTIENQTKLPSLVICPPTLTGHWVYEVKKFIANHFLSPLQYFGLPIERERLRHQFGNYNLIVASYDIVRKDIDFFQTIHWNYCVLDEGHIIKNGKTKSSKAIKLLSANHRLILSGTPIQNNVLELWSLFDFLMPGFLGSEKQFQIKFSKPILASRDPKSSPKEQEAGALAMESLHRQVLPFLLRRVKEDVLTDLPPKITQDLLCELSPLQERLYEDFSKTHLDSDLRESLENISITSDSVNKKTHVFQALRYLQNVCNHPKLVLKPHHPEYQNIIGDLQKGNTSLDDIEHSAKLPALKQLLLDCGIGTNDDISVNQHRALVFCQLKAMLDIIENDLLKKHLPNVSYLRLDGSIAASMRHEIVANFNNDPSIDVLLLTTQVGGLGLNLTGADTVIFVEHDYNPMKDLQAMDRAHRIGQKKVVNVYRLITRKSLEEKIMGLQKFKLLTANTVVSVSNQSMDTMGTDQLLDLFNLSENEKDSKKHNQNKSKGSIKCMIENLPELWDDNQYDEEFDITQFIEQMKK